MVAAATVSEAPQFQASRKKEKSKKAKAIPLPYDNKALMDRYDAACKAFNDAEAEKNEVVALLKVECEPLRLAEALKRRAAVQTILLAGRVEYCAKKQFSKIDVDRGEKLCQLFNGHFSNYFEKVTKQELDWDALDALKDNPDVQAAWLTLNQKLIIVADESYKPTDVFYSDYTLDESVRTLAIGEGITPQCSIDQAESISAK